MMLKRIVTFLFVVIVTGCAAKGPSYHQILPTIPVLSQGYGRLYFMNSLTPHARVEVDKNLIGECKFGAFFGRIFRQVLISHLGTMYQL